MKRPMFYIKKVLKQGIVIDEYLDLYIQTNKEELLEFFFTFLRK